MNNYREITGDLIYHAKNFKFDLIAHGCNCFCKMKSGVAKAISENYPQAVEADNETIPGDYLKLGNFTSADVYKDDELKYRVVNCYTQFNYGRDGRVYLDYEALTLCLRKINFKYAGKRIGLPLIGCGLAGGDWKIVKDIIIKELPNLYVTVVKL